MNTAELTLIGLWAHGHWTDIAWACKSGDLQTGVNGLVGGSVHGDTVDALNGGTTWSADRPGLTAYRFTGPDDPTDDICPGRTVTVEVRWSKVNAWLWQDGGWTVADRKALYQAYVDFYAVYPPREDERWQPCDTTEQGRERSARYDVRMAGPDGDQMRAARARAVDLIMSHLQAPAALF